MLYAVGWLGDGDCYSLVLGMKLDCISWSHTGGWPHPYSRYRCSALYHIMLLKYLQWRIRIKSYSYYGKNYCGLHKTYMTYRIVYTKLSYSLLSQCGMNTIPIVRVYKYKHALDIWINWLKNTITCSKEPGEQQDRREPKESEECYMVHVKMLSQHLLWSLNEITPNHMQHFLLHIYSLIAPTPSLWPVTASPIVCWIGPDK